MSSVATEHVLVVPTPVFHSLGHFQGFCGDTDRYLRGLLDPQHTSYRPRAAMEQDPTFKQLIPYCLFRYRDASGSVSGDTAPPAASTRNVVSCRGCTSATIRRGRVPIASFNSSRVAGRS